MHKSIILPLLNAILAEVSSAEGIDDRSQESLTVIREFVTNMLEFPDLHTLVAFKLNTGVYTLSVKCAQGYFNETLVCLEGDNDEHHNPPMMSDKEYYRRRFQLLDSSSRSAENGCRYDKKRYMLISYSGNERRVTPRMAWCK